MNWIIRKVGITGPLSRPDRYFGGTPGDGYLCQSHLAVASFYGTNLGRWESVFLK